MTRRLPVSEAGLRRAYHDQRFLDELVGIVARTRELDIDEPFDDSDAWWWLCDKLPTMLRYKRTDLKATARRWVQSMSYWEVMKARARGEAGEFTHLQGVGSATRTGAEAGTKGGS